MGITSKKRTGGGIAARLCSMVNWNCVNPARFLLGAIFSLWEQPGMILRSKKVDQETEKLADGTLAWRAVEWGIWADGEPPPKQHININSGVQFFMPLSLVP